MKLNASEFIEQKNLIKWASYNPVLKKLLFSIPNGGSRNLLEAVNLKKTGVKSGVPDIFVALPNKKYHGMFIEMKRIGGRLTKTQSDFIKLLNEKGYYAVVCFGFLEAKREIEEYLKGI